VSHSASATHGAVIGIGHRSIGPVSGLPCARKVALCAYSVGGVALRLAERNPRAFLLILRSLFECYSIDVWRK
jgi:hypothetical protein